MNLNFLKTTKLARRVPHILVAASNLRMIESKCVNGGAYVPEKLDFRTLAVAFRRAEERRPNAPMAPARAQERTCGVKPVTVSLAS